MSAPWNGQPASPPPDDGSTPPDWLYDRHPVAFSFDAHLLTDAHGIVLNANLAAVRLLHCAREFLVGKPLGLFVADRDRATFYATLTRLPRVGTADSMEVRIGRHGMEPRDVVVVFGAVGDDAETQPTVYRWVLRDVTGVKRTERELDRERRLLDGVVDAAEAIILMVDVGGRVVRSNAYLEDASDLGPAQLRGRDWANTLLTPADRPAGRRVLGRALAHGSARSGPLGLLGRAGAVRSVIWSARGLTTGAESAIVLVGHDVTELQEAQARAIHSERLAAIGQMAAGLAHESRNALQRGQACLSLLGLRLADRPDLIELIGRAQRAQDDLHRLYQGVLDYAAPVRLDPAPCEPAVVWREAWADLASTSTWGEAELVEENCDPDTCCRADGFHLRRVFRNLFENARAAVAGPLRVTITCDSTTLRDRPALRIGVRDNGPGFPPETRAKLFDAFFTTKTHGTGLGLALCKRVIDEHGGRIKAGPDGPGAEVIITLPRSTP
jgi:PAS domain S-box-containing protein